MRRAVRAVLSCLALFAAVAHCSVLVESDLSELGCEQEGTIGVPACDPGQLCAAGRCRACSALDVCDDGLDNDCNGRVDDRCDGGAKGGAGGQGAGGAGGVTGVAGGDGDWK